MIPPIGLHRAQTLVHAVARTSVAFPINRWHRLRRGFEEMEAPITRPTVGLREIHAAAAVTVPGAKIRRRLLWRYTLVWVKPAA